MFLALDSDVCGNSLFTCLSVPPPASLKSIDLLQSNLTRRHNLKDNHIPQSVAKHAARAEGTDPSEDGGKGRRSQWSLRDAASSLGAGAMPWPRHPLAPALVRPKPKSVASSLTAARAVTWQGAR